VKGRRLERRDNPTSEAEMKIKKLVDVYLKVEFWAPYSNDPNLKEGYAKDFIDFVKDHRSQDMQDMQIVKITEESCEYCGYNWEVDEAGIPQCCNKAQEEYHGKTVGN